MSYGLISETVDTYGPTTYGMMLLREAVEATGTKYPTLLEFVQDNITHNPQQLAIEANQFLRTIDNEDIKASLLNIAEAALKSKERLEIC